MFVDPGFSTAAAAAGEETETCFPPKFSGLLQVLYPNQCLETGETTKSLFVTKIQTLGLYKSSPPVCPLVMMNILGGRSAASLHRMNVTAGYKGVVGRTCKTDPNRCLSSLVVFMI